MGISWHTVEYVELVNSIREFFEDSWPEMNEADIHDNTNSVISILINHGAVDPT